MNRSFPRLLGARLGPFRIVEGIGGTIHVRTHEDFAATFARLLSDEAARAALARQRADVLTRYTRFDGRAAERIAGLISEAIGGPGSSAGRGAESTAPDGSTLKVGV